MKGHERFEVKVTPKYLNAGTHSREVLLKMSVGRDEVKARDFRVEGNSQDDIREMSDCTESKVEVEQKDRRDVREGYRLHRGFGVEEEVSVS